MCFSLNKEMSYFYPDLLPRFAAQKTLLFTLSHSIHYWHCTYGAAFPPYHPQYSSPYIHTKKFISDWKKSSQILFSLLPKLDPQHKRINLQHNFWQFMRNCLRLVAQILVLQIFCVGNERIRALGPPPFTFHDTK